MDDHVVTEAIVEYDPDLWESFAHGGTWPHANHFGFNEAVAAAHYIQRGYHVLRSFCTTSRDVKGNGLSHHSTNLMHDIVGPDVSHYFCSELAALCHNGSGEPDLFVFYEPTDDPKVHYPDGPSWFFVEVKGPGDVVRDNQKLFWRQVVSRPDLGLGPDRLVLVRTVPRGESVAPAAVTF